MPNSSMPNIPGMSAMTETFDFVKKMWGGMGTSAMGIPGMVMPTLSVEEVDKQIKDLKAVETWLNMNMNMLRGTIQALEVQSATITTLRTMGENFSAAVAPDKGAGFTSPFSSPKPAAMEAEDEQIEAEKAAERRRSREALKAEFKTESTTENTAAQPNPAIDGEAGNPAQWWNLLQDQFKQAVSTAMSPDAMVAAANVAGSKTGKSAAKPAAKTARKSAAKPAAKTAKTAKRKAA